ncbi:MAG: oligosaccharide flippase family protein [Bacteroidales bacterium]|nr:oligosaccharide flippase family protein [Bacteroidales bacterium]
MESRYKRLGKNSIIVFLGNAGSKIIGILMLPFYTHYLSTSGYGTYDIVNTYSAVLLPFVTCCIADSIFIFPKDKSILDKTRYFTSGLIFCSFTLAIVLFLSYLISIAFPCSFIGRYVWWIVGLTFSTFILNYVQQFTRSIDKMIVYSLTGIVHVLAIALLSLVLLPTYKLNGYLLALIISSLISAVFALLFSKSLKYFRLKEYNKRHLIELLRYGVPLIPNTVMWWLVDGINRPIMMSEIGTDAIGIYAIANKMPGFISMLFVVFSNAWGISMLEEYGKKDFNLFFNRTMKNLVFVIAIGSSLLITCSKLMVSILASSEFNSAWKYVPILIVGVMFQYISTLVGGVFMAERKSKYFFYSSVLGATVSVLMTFALIKVCALYGVCIAVTLSFMCMAIVRIKYAWKSINLFDIRYYVFTFFVLILQACIYIFNWGVLVDIVTMVVSITLIVMLNRKELSAVMLLLKRIIKKDEL